jgi:hypothetical protein
VVRGRGALALAAVVVCGCGTAEREARAPAVTDLRATLDDRDAEPSSGRGGWSTTWRLCWDAPPRATYYELQALTSEGAGPVRRSVGRCFSLEVAAGDGRASGAFLRRAQQLAATRSQLAYRVRAVSSDGDRGPWSREIDAGAIR